MLVRPTVFLAPLAFLSVASAGLLVPGDAPLDRLDLDGLDSLAVAQGPLLPTEGPAALLGAAEPTSALALAHGLAGVPADGSLAAAVALAKLASADQAASLGFALPPPAGPGGPTAGLPSEAALALAERHGVQPDDGELAALRALDGLPAAQAAALAEAIAAFLAFEDASRAAPPAGTDLGVDLGAVVQARGRLLDASLALTEAWGALPAGPQVALAAPTLDLCPALALDLDGFDTSYAAECALVVDLAGDDLYTNNAGGAGFPSPDTCLIAPESRAAAVLDLSGDDRYASGEKCGTNGGGVGGNGFLLDGSGNDEYLADEWGGNGGGAYGTGFLLDASGHDTYRGSDSGVNGGAYAGAGLLLDAFGNDRYAAGSFGTNGGSYVGGAALLADASGDDSYSAVARGANGGGELGVAALVDLRGTDSYADSEGGTGTDVTVAPKGLVGAQVDAAL